MPVTSRKKATARPARSEAATRVLRQFRIVFNAVKAHFRTVEKSAGLAGAQAWALSVVRDQPGIGVAALAQAMDVHQSTASNLLAPLLAQGLVLANRADADRRAVELKISAKGRRVLSQVPGPFEGVLPDVLRKLDAARLARLQEDLAALIAQLPVARRGANIPLGQPTEAPARPRAARKTPANATPAGAPAPRSARAGASGPRRPASARPTGRR